MSMTAIAMHREKETIRPAMRYVVLLLAFALLLVVKTLLAATTVVEAPFTLLLAAVIIAAWNGGIRPGLMATGATVAAVYLFLPHYHDARITEQALKMRLFQFLFEGVTISFLCGFRKASSEQAARRFDKQRAATSGYGVTAVAIDSTSAIPIQHTVAETVPGLPATEEIGFVSDSVPNLSGEERSVKVECAIHKPFRSGGAEDVFSEYYSRMRSEVAREDVHRRTDTVAERIGDACSAVEQDRLRAVLDQMPVGVLFAEATSGRFVVANRRLRELLGQSDAARVVINPNVPVAPILHRALQGEVVEGDEISRPLPEGRLGWLRVNAAPIRDRQDALAGAVLVIDDATAEKETQQSLQRSHAVLRSQLATISEDERRRFSRELHDETSQQLTALALGLKAAREQAVTNPDSLPAALESLQAQAAAVNEALHRIAWELRPAVLDDIGLEPAVRDAVGRWARQAGMQVEFQSTLGYRRQKPDLETHLYRIVNEAIANAVKHAGAGRIGVVLDGPPNEVRVIVEDDGRGFDPEATAEPGGRRLGLQGMAERAALIGGTLQVESQPGRGTTVFVRVPLAVHLGRNH